MQTIRTFSVLCALILLFELTVVLETLKAIELTWPFNDKATAWGPNKRFKFTLRVSQDKENGKLFSFNEFEMAEHAGTHLDAPYHFHKNRWKIGDIPLSNLVGNGVTIDLSHETEKLDHDAVFLPQHLIDWEKRNGPIPKNSIILVNFNWGKYIYDNLKYLGGETPKDYKFPGISPEAAQWMIDSGKVLGVGTDTASFDVGKSMDFPVHNMLLKHNIYGVENVRIPKSLPEKGYSLSVMPMLIEDGTAAPARVVAYLK